MSAGFNETATQRLAIADVINSQSVNNASVSSIGIDMLKFRRAFWTVSNGGLGAAGTIDGRIQTSPNSNFNVVHNIANTNLTQMNTNNVIASMEIRSDQVIQANPGDRYARINLTGAGNAITVFAQGFGIDAIQSPGNQYNLNSAYVNQQVVANN